MKIKMNVTMEIKDKYIQDLMDEHPEGGIEIDDVMVGIAEGNVVFEDVEILELDEEYHVVGIIELGDDEIIEIAEELGH